MKVTAEARREEGGGSANRYTAATKGSAIKRKDQRN